MERDVEGGGEALHATPRRRNPLSGATRRSRAVPESDHVRGPQAAATLPRQSLVGGIGITPGNLSVTGRISNRLKRDGQETTPLTFFSLCHFAVVSNRVPGRRL